MGKASRRKKKKNVWVRQTPDEVLERGPLRIERYGRFIRMRNLSTPEEHAETLKRAKEANKKILAELERDVKALQSLVGKHDPLELMHRAAYELLPLFIDYRSESDLIGEESYYLPTVEYLQYLIARTQMKGDGTAPTEEEWQELWQLAQKVLQLTQSHLMTRRTTKEPPSEIDHLRFMIDSQRLGVRVNRYPLFHADHLRSSLLPYEKQIKAAYGLTVEEIIAGLDPIAEYQKRGVVDRYTHVREATETLMKRLADAGFDIRPGLLAEEVARVQATLATDEFKEEHERANEAARLTFTPAIFDITDLTSLPNGTLPFCLCVRASPY